MHRGGRIGFLLAALHSVAARVNPRKARPPAPHGPRVLARQRVPFAAAGKRVRDSRAQQVPEHRVLRSFPPPGTQRDGSESGTKLRIVAAQACGAVFGQTGMDRVGWYACPWLTLFATEWSAARRKRPTAAVVHLRATISADLKAVRFRRAAAENFRPEIFEARATLREQRESAVGRRIGKPHTSPFARRPHRTPPPPQPLRSVPVCQESGTVPIYSSAESSARAACGLRTFAPLMKYRNTSPARARVCARSRQRASAAGA